MTDFPRGFNKRATTAEILGHYWGTLLYLAVVLLRGVDRALFVFRSGIE